MVTNFIFNPTKSLQTSMKYTGCSNLFVKFQLCASVTLWWVSYASLLQKSIEVILKYIFEAHILICNDIFITICNYIQNTYLINNSRVELLMKDDIFVV